jgi:two-component system cell cycle sensor histidine kinase/response regulator CckA
VVKGNRILGMNGPARDMLGVDLPENNGQGWSLSKIFDRESEKCLQAMLERTGADAFPVPRACTLVSREGKNIHGTLSVEMVVSGLAVVGLAAETASSLPVQSELQQASRLESLGLLAGGLAHDFNNILTGIIGNINLALQAASPGSPVYGRLWEAEKASLIAKNLTEKLLTFSRGGSPELNPVRMDELIRENVCFVESGSATTCRCAFAPDLWPVEINEGLIILAMTNLLINAKQAMAGEGEIRITAENTFIDGSEGLRIERGRYVQVSFSDAGTGIDEKDLPRIFDPYFTTRPNGTGLGLAIVHSIISQHRGAITVESRKRKGTTFHIFLPAAAERTASS